MWRSLKETQEYLNALQVSVSDDKKNGIIDSLIVKDWLRNKDTQDYLSVAKSLIISRSGNSPHGNELTITRKGGTPCYLLEGAA